MAKQLAVVGAGLMGSGIAQVSAAAGYDVILRDVTPEATARGMAGIGKSLSRFVAKGRISREDADATLSRITTTTDLGAAGSADVVVEAVFEDIEVKHAVFRELDKIAKDGAILATNTSALPITQVA
ncbi:MAG: 3-hydroxyacyl-CoA dehydrogenase family protein, partial [Actinocrinis sp.]